MAKTIHMFKLVHLRTLLWCCHLVLATEAECVLLECFLVAGSLESANSSILASCDHFKEVVGKKIRVL